MNMAKYFNIIIFLFLFWTLKVNATGHQNRIIGGNDAKAGQFNFAATINVTTSSSNFFCMGSLIDLLSIVTSGHCVYNGVLFVVQIGSIYLEEVDDNRVIVSTYEGVAHPDFNPGTLENDIGIVKLRDHMWFTDYIGPVYLPIFALSNNTPVTLIGWGQMSDSNSQLSEILQTTEAVTLSNLECQLTYGTQINSNMVCAAGNYNEGTCVGCAVFCFTSAALAPAISSRIIGGETANAGEYPSTVALNIQTSTGTYFCGGVLYDINWVLTSGHCAYQAVLFTIRIGSNVLTGADSNRQTFTSSEFIVHPSFDPNSFKNDLALIKFRLPISYSLYIQPLRLPWNPIVNESSAMAVGWGTTSDFDDNLSESLQSTSVSVLYNTECMSYYGNQIDENIVCVVGNYNEGSCNGDTGSPLYQPYIYHVWVTVGIATFVSGNGCESPEPSGYTRVYPFNAWIKNVTGTP